MEGLQPCYITYMCPTEEQPAGDMQKQYSYNAMGKRGQSEKCASVTEAAASGVKALFYMHAGICSPSEMPLLWL